MTNMPIPRQQHQQPGGGTTDVTNNQAFVTNTTTIPATTLILGYRCDETATSRDPRNLLAAYEDRRKSRVRQLNVWLSEAKKFNIAAGKHRDDISQCHENVTTAFNSDDDAVDNCFGRRDAVLPLSILTEILGSCHGSSSAMQPPPYLESHPDDVLFTSCKNLCELIDFTALDSEPKSLFSESNNGPEDTKNNQF